MPMLEDCEPERIGLLTRGPFGGMMGVSSNHHFCLFRSTSMVHTTPTKVLLATTLRPLVVQLSGSLAQGVRLIEQCLHEEPTPQKMAKFEWALRAL